MAIYDTESPWANTTIANSQYLDILSIRPVPAEPDDIVYTIENKYMYRPDLLAYDLYGSIKLWWIFSQRNMDIIKDPIYDMVPGVKIFLPKSSNLTKTLGT